MRVIESINGLDVAAHASGELAVEKLSLRRLRELDFESVFERGASTSSASPASFGSSRPPLTKSRSASKVEGRCNCSSSSDLPTSWEVVQLAVHQILDLII